MKIDIFKLQRMVEKILGIIVLIFLLGNSIFYNPVQVIGTPSLVLLFILFFLLLIFEMEFFKSKFKRISSRLESIRNWQIKKKVETGYGLRIFIIILVLFNIWLALQKKYVDHRVDLFTKEKFVDVKYDVTLVILLIYALTVTALDMVFKHYYDNMEV